MVDWENTPENVEDYQGFVYIVTELDTGMKYIGKKNFWKTVKYPPLKGRKNKRHKKVQSDWKTYNTSSPELSCKLNTSPNNYKKEIARLCTSKEEMSVFEAYMQLQAYVNGEWSNYYNEVINLRLRLRK